MPAAKLKAAASPYNAPLPNLARTRQPMHYALTIFASAFLLFLLQPIVAKQILPWFGGSAAVWTTCLVFFQSTLLLGYAYADFSVRRLAPRMQARVHLALLVISILLLPIIPGTFWKPSGQENPIPLILGLLAVTIGLPYFVLSTTSPLVQAWFAREHPGRSPYRLFALSNLASMLALLGYPFLLEPWIATRMQAWGWSAGYVLFVGLCAAMAIRGGRRIDVPLAAAGEAADRSAVVMAPTSVRQVLWCALAATSSALLLAVTNHITQNIAAVPLLWIVPLSLYLISFILCFDGMGWYRRETFLAMLAAALGVMGWTLADPKLTHVLSIQLDVFCGGFFLACMFCHGELVTLKPAPRYLTRFYLMISLGGALGSILVGVVSPLVFNADFDLAIALVACALLLLWQTRREKLVFRALALLSLAFTIGCGIWSRVEFYTDTIVTSRNFYGVLRVQDSGEGDADHRRTLIHGTIMHGKQYQSPSLKTEPTSYYTRSSGIGRAIEALHPRRDPIRVGVIGLGTGTLASYGSKGDVYRVYDINPGVVTIAQRDFSYLKDSDATIELSLGDARLSLEREPPQQFDVLAVDAFSSDAIPVHLITREAVQVYLRHMKPDGIIAYHLTNRYLNLVPVVESIAHELGLHALWIEDEGDDPMANSSNWVLLAKDPARLDDPVLADAATPLETRRDWRVWTDDFNNLVQVLK
jgi:SAM-dependent methyltransferase